MIREITQESRGNKYSPSVTELKDRSLTNIGRSSKGLATKVAGRLTCIPFDSIVRCIDVGFSRNVGTEHK